MLVSNFLIKNAAFKLAVNDGTIFVKGEQKATFNGVYCCANTWRHCGLTDEGANIVTVNMDGERFELFFTYTHWRNGMQELPITDLVLVSLTGDNSPQFPFHFEP